ncbi:MAG: hypothetical protein JW940_04015 [Polyangiaceae bacterium]|nr:hypothetical protein [Polyangiaceae bacterium]
MSNTLRPARILTLTTLGAVALAMSLGTSRTAQAQEKCGETECPKGYTCETESAGCPLIDCAEGEDCKPCEPAEYSYCVAAECETDADCGAHMKCAALEQTECSGEAPPATEPCDPDTECKVAASDVAVECTTTTIHLCQPQWMLPCETAADCGEGFACKEQESCWCSGSAGGAAGGGTGTSGVTNGTAGASSGGAASVDLPLPKENTAADDTGAAEDADAAEGDVAAAEDVAAEGDVAVAPPPDEQCGCEPTGEFACEVVETACTTDSDCPADWTCEDNPMGSCWADSEGNSGCTPADPARLCQPPYSRLGGGAYGEATVGGTTGAVDLWSEDGQADNAEAPKAADPDADGSAASGDSGHAAAVPEDADEEEAAAARGDADGPSAAPDEDDAVVGSSLAGGGCSVSAGSGHAGQLGLMLAAAMAALGLRRRSAR